MVPSLLLPSAIQCALPCRRHPEVALAVALHRRGVCAHEQPRPRAAVPRGRAQHAPRPVREEWCRDVDEGWRRMLEEIEDVLGIQSFAEIIEPVYTFLKRPEAE